MLALPVGLASGCIGGPAPLSPGEGWQLACRKDYLAQIPLRLENHLTVRSSWPFVNKNLEKIVASYLAAERASKEHQSFIKIHLV